MTKHCRLYSCGISHKIYINRKKNIMNKYDAYFQVMCFFASKIDDIFLISPQKHVVGTH